MFISFFSFFLFFFLQSSMFKIIYHINIHAEILFATQLPKKMWKKRHEEKGTL